MGMFDILYVSKSLRPLTVEEQRGLPDNPGWQTKDFDCAMDEIYITDEGDITIHRTNYLMDESVNLETDESRVEFIKYHGYVRFYTSVDGKRVEFRAKFTDGKLVKIERS